MTAATRAVPSGERGLLTVGVMAATLMQVLDSTIANVALPNMQASLGASPEAATWILTSYIVAAAVLMPLTGWLAQRVGPRRLYLASVVLFVIASMLCGIATSLEEMVAFRVLQGAAGAFLTPLGQTVLLDINPPENHGKAMALYGMGVMIGPILGPIIGGWLTEYYSWRWSFYINLPIGIAALALLWALLPRNPGTRRPFDLLGFSTLALGVGMFQLMLDRGQPLDWFQDIEIWIEAALALSAFWIFIVHVSGGRALFAPTMFADRNFATALAFSAVMGALLLGGMALMPSFLQRLYGYPVLDTGILLAPRGIGVFITMAVVGRVIGRVDPRPLVAAGFALTALSLWQMTRFSLEMGWEPVVFSGVVQGLGLGLLFVPLNTLAFATLDPRFRTEASSLINLARSLGGSIGISIATTMLTRNAQISHADLAGTITTERLAVGDPGLLEQFGQTGAAALAALDAEVTRQAVMIAYLDDFKLLMLMTLAAIPFTILLRRGSARAGRAPVIVD